MATFRPVVSVCDAGAERYGKHQESAKHWRPEAGDACGVDAQDFDLEDEIGVRWDGAAAALLAIREVGRAVDARQRAQR